jgi:RimJ/RimL family protein N-acetyltransferase
MAVLTRPPPTIRRLHPAEAGAFVAFRRAYLAAEPLSFASSPDSDFLGSPEEVRRQLTRDDGSTILGAFDDGLVGTSGIYREGRPKASHKMFIWGVYVLPSHRGGGLGRRLLDACLDHARSVAGVEIVHLGVTDAASAARRVYEGAGFRLWGSEPDALRHEGRSVAEHHYVLSLD